jgi:hypothetical protein
MKARELGFELSLGECERMLPAIQLTLAQRKGAVSDVDLRRMLAEQTRGGIS